MANLYEFERQILDLPLDGALMNECLGAFTMLLSSHLQGFCRELYSEFTGHFVRHAPANLRDALEIQCTTKIDLNQGNPTFSAITNDFRRFGISISDELKNVAGNGNIGMHIERMQKWRNYYAHNNPEKPVKAGPFNRTEIMKWMASCNDLAEALDSILSNHLKTLGIAGW